MAEVIRMPRMSDTMEEGNIVAWHKSEGDSIEPGDLLAEIETDKATMDFESLHEGVLLHIAIKEGTVPIDGVIAVIGEAGEDWQAAIAASAKKDDASGEASAEKATEVTPAAAETPVPAETHSDSRILASPLARSMAKEAGIDLNLVTGTGTDGRIVKRDIEARIASGAPSVPAPAPAATPAPVAASPTPAAAPSTPAPAAPAPTPAVVPFSFAGGGNNYEDQPISQMRKVIARRLGESKFSAPHFYLTIEIDMANAMKLRKQLNAVAPVKLSFNDLVLKAAAVALRQHPAVNSSWLGDAIRVNKDVNIGVAVAVDDGLLVPVVRHADIKTLSQINTEVKEMAGRARIRKLQPDEMSGNTFTISNLGMFGIDEFTAIINPPDACIMAVGGIVAKPVVENGEIVVGQRMKVTLSCDHRVVDGATGAKFLNTFKEILEDPIRILV